MMAAHTLSKDSTQGVSTIGFIRKFNHAFVLKEDAVRRIWQLLLPEATVSATAVCADGAQRVFEKADSLVEYSNSKSNKIFSLSFECRLDKDRYSSVQISLEPVNGPHTSLGMLGKYCENLELRAGLLDELAGMKSWYSFVSRSPCAAILAILLFFPTLLLVLTFLDIDIGSNVQSEKVSVLILLVVLFTYSVLYVPLKLIHVLFFPMGDFALGQGLDRHSFDDKIRFMLTFGVSSSMLSYFVLRWLL